MRNQWPTRTIAVAFTLGCGEPARIDPPGSTDTSEPLPADVLEDCPAADTRGAPTLQAAIDATAPGGTVVLCDRPGGHPGPVVVRHDLTLVGPATIHGGPGPALHILSGHVRLVGLTLSGGTGAVEPRLAGDTHGGVVAGWDADGLWIEDSVVEGGEADWGGCITGPRSGPLMVVRSTITNCHARKLGGGVWLRQGGLEDSTVASSTAPYGGGLAVRTVDVADGDVFLGDSVIQGNDGEVQGGGMLVTGPADVFGGRFEANTSPQGAGVFLAEATGGWHGGEATANIASVGGGGVYVRSGQVRLTDLRVTGNEASGWDLPDGRGVGGGLWVSGDAGTHVALDGVVFEDNVGAWGAGVMVAGAGEADAGPLLDVLGGAWTSQHGEQGGGAAVVGARLVARDTQVQDNSADEGGGVWLERGQLDVQGGLWAGNTPDDIFTPGGAHTGVDDRGLWCDDAGCVPAAE